MTVALESPLSDRTCLRNLSQQALPGVELWWVDLDAYAANVTLAGFTSSELARATSMTIAADARRFLASRHALRELLGNRLGVSPATLFIEASDLGKPVVRDRGEGTVHFNSSRSGAEGVFAIGADQPVGVDIEVVREVRDAHALARLHFSDRERSAWLQETDAHADLAFLTCWTRKEACVKALGVGLTLPLDRIEVGCGTGLCTAAIRNDASQWNVEVVSLPAPGSGIIAVACVKDQLQ